MQTKQELIDEIKGKYEKNILSGNYCYRWQYFEKALSELYDRLQFRKWFDKALELAHKQEPRHEKTPTECVKEAREALQELGNEIVKEVEPFFTKILDILNKPKRREIKKGRPCFFSNYAKEWQTINSYKCRDSSNLHLSKNMIDGRVVWKYARPVPDGFQGDFDSIPLPTEEDR